MKKTSFRCFAPASVGNVGPGFDCFGFALDSIGDEVELRVKEAPGLSIVEIEGDQGRLPREVSKNTAGRAAEALWEMFPDCHKQFGLDIYLKKGLPLCSGLGSSSASAVAGAYAAAAVVAEINGTAIDLDQVLKASLEGEKVASGDYHADNVAPTLYGGFTLVQSSKPLRLKRFLPKIELSVVLVTPEIEIPTIEARSILPKEVPLNDVVKTIGNTSSIILSMITGDIQLLSQSMDDFIIEPARSKLIPGFSEIKEAAIQCGAINLSISGAGPTLFSFCDTKEKASDIADAIRGVFSKKGISSFVTFSSMSNQGAKLI